MKKSTYGFIFAIVALVILLGVTLYLGLSGWFYANVTEFESDIKLGETVSLMLDGTQSKALSFTFPGSYLPGQKIAQNINITNGGSSDLYVRAKAIVFDYEKGECELEIGTSEHWTKEGEYYYFDEKLLLSNKISLASYIKLNPEGKYSSIKQYVVTIVVEGLDSKFDRAEVWGY